MEKSHSSVKLVIATGGTGGHLFPAQALAQGLLDQEKKMELIFMGAYLGSSPYFDHERFSYMEIVSGTPFKKRMLACLKGIFSLVKGSCQSLKFLRKFRPRLVVGFGSFHSFPVLFAATFLRIPIVLFESNIFPGRVNRFFSRWAKVSTVYFSKASKYLRSKSICVRSPFLKEREGASKREARKYFALHEDRLTFLVFGGSQGAQTINRFFCGSLEKLINKGLEFQVIHLAGNMERAEKLKEIYKRFSIPAYVKSFEKKIDLAWSAADLSISRAGAGTIAEQIEFSVPGILIPYPYASENHQEKNAQFLSEEVGGSILLKETDLTTDRLLLILDDLLGSSRHKLREMKEALVAFKDREQQQSPFHLVLEELKV
jgi:UDP-N-acetylglucosamine--N-acetylmuramyl-(pentapeptide) pyrophosphoryl-undecaprenol N-acetylglucosamine transferase